MSQKKATTSQLALFCLGLAASGVQAGYYSNRNSMNNGVGTHAGDNI